VRKKEFEPPSSAFLLRARLWRTGKLRDGRQEAQKYTEIRGEKMN